jgi:hypothetical protein
MKPILRSLLTLAAAILIALLTGCASSVHPFYTPQDVKFDPTLLGSWTPVEAATERTPDSTTWKCESAENGSYIVTIGKPSVPEEVEEFTTHLFEIHGEKYIDAVLTRKGSRVFTMFGDSGSSIQTHRLLKVAKIHPKLLLQQLNDGWLRKVASDTKNSIPHLPATPSAHDPIVLTGTTEELQTLILRAEKEGAFGKDPEGILLQRP